MKDKEISPEGSNFFTREEVCPVCLDARLIWVNLTLLYAKGLGGDGTSNIVEEPDQQELER